MSNYSFHELMRLGDVIDNLIAKDYMARGISNELYDYIKSIEKVPLVMSAAIALTDRVKMGDRVLIFTGWPSCSWLMKGLTETDGPVGAAILARVMEESLGVVPIIVMEQSLIHFGETALRAAGLIVSNLETALKSKTVSYQASVGAVISLSSQVEEAKLQSTKMLSDICPAALISIELPGANKEYKYHDSAAREIPTESVMKADEVFKEGKRRGILTIGIGDGGNELGMANAAPVIEKYLKDGEMIAPVTTVDKLVVSCISNWGALGLAACIVAVTGKSEVFDHIDIVRITNCLVDEGAVDGLTAYVDPKNDGASQKVNIGLSEIMSMTLKMYMNGWIKNSTVLI